jgi:addiction module HigA family antidote
MATRSGNPVPRRPPVARATPVIKSSPGPVAHREPLHPGQLLDTRYLKPLGITQQELARDLGVSRRRINELIRGRRGITADTAIRLAIYFEDEASFWMQLQSDWDLHEAAKRLGI